MEYSVIDNTTNLIGPLTMSFDITNKCMLKCLHCYNRSGDDLKRNELTDSEILRITENLSKFHMYSFCFCGGEALIRYELVLKMCEILKRTGTNLNIVSNGWLIDDEKVKKLKEVGMNHIQISVDGNNSQIHDYMRNVAGSFEKAINAIEVINKNDMNISVAFCPTSFNIDEFPLLVKRLSKYKHIIKIRVQPFMLLGRGSINNIYPSENQYRNLVKFIKKYNNSVSYPEIEWGDPIDHLIRWTNLGLKSILHGDIKSNGDLMVSPYLPIVVGNLRKHSYEEYWNSGLNRCWQIPLLKEIVPYYYSIGNLGSKVKNIPKIFFEDSIRFDLIDDNVFSNLDKYTLRNFFKEE